MERSPRLPSLPSLTDFESRGGLRQSAQQIYNYLTVERQKLEALFAQVATDLNYLYGEASFSGASGNTTIVVPGAMPGFPVIATFDQGFGVSAYVSAPDVVTVTMPTGTTLAAGKLRVWVTPKILT